MAPPRTALLQACARSVMRNLHACVGQVSLLYTLHVDGCLQATACTQIRPRRIAHPPRPAPSPYLRALRLVCRDGGGELLIVLAIAARFCDLAELLGGARHVTLGQERLAHVLARSRVGRIDGQRAA